MAVRTAGIRDTVLLGTACAAGVVVSPQLPYVGLPVTAAAVAGLAYQGRLTAGLIALAAGVVGVALVLPQAVVFAAPVALVVLLAVWLLPRVSAGLTAAVLTVAIASSAILADTLSARLLGQSLTEAVRSESTAVTAAFKQALGASGSEITEQLEAVRRALVMLWPSFYIQSAIFAAVFIIAAISWAASRNGVELKVPKARDLDLSLHVLWLLVVGLVGLAAASVAGVYAYEVRSVALNMLYVARTLFFLQGVAVFSALFDVPKTGYGKMVGLYIALYLVDQVLLIVSLAGLLDFWANFRRLPRDGAPTVVRVEEPPGQY